MKKYTKLISNLIEQKLSSQKTYSISLYLKADKNKVDINQHLKSKILEGFKENKKLKSLTKLQNYLVEELSNRINSLEISHGVAAFVRFNINDASLDNFTNIEINIINLDKAPEEEIFVDKIFNIDQLSWINDSAYDAIVVYINANDSSIYHLDGSSFQKIDQIKKPDIAKHEKEYQGQSTPPRVQGAFHGNGENKIEGMNKREHQELLKLTFNRLLEIKATNNFNYLVVFYTNAFTDFISEYIQSKIATMPNVTPIVEQKNLIDSKHAEECSREVINEIQKESYRQMLDTAKENYYTYIEGLEKVSDAAQKRSIDTLFLSPTLKQDGYVVDQNLVFTKPVESSKYVKNIVPWIVKNVIESGGRIVILKNILSQDISAKLRY